MAALMMSGCTGSPQPDLYENDKYLGDLSSDSPHDVKARNQEIQRLITDANKDIEKENLIIAAKRLKRAVVLGADKEAELGLQHITKEYLIWAEDYAINACRTSESIL